MPTLTIKDVPADLLTRLKTRAEKNRRSLNQEVLMMLERQTPRPATEEEMEAFRAMRARNRASLTGPPLTHEEIRAAINEGRE